MADRERGKGPVVLVHGAWSNASTWAGVAARLAAMGREVISPDLPAHGPDRTPPAEVGLLEYAHHVADVLAPHPQALLVGHSMGGMVVSAAAELAPERIRKLVYVTAFLPLDGQSLLDLIKQQDIPGVRNMVRPGAEPGSTVLNAEQAADALFHDATAEQRTRALSGLGPQPNRPQTDRIHLTPARFGRLPRAYVFCTDDKTISPALQQEMAAASPCAESFSLACGHLPQLTRPAELADILGHL